MAVGAVTRVALLATLSLTAGCSKPAGTVASHVQHSADCSYTARLRPAHKVDVTVHCRGAAPTGFRAEPGVARFISELSTAGGSPLDFVGDTVKVEEPGVHYRVDLGRMAEERRDFNHALRVGNSIIAPGYSWMLSPVEVPDNLPVELLVNGFTPEQRFVSGLQSDGSRYVLRANEIRVSTFGIFGRFEHETLEFGGLGGIRSELDVVTLDGPLAVGTTVRRRWIEETAQAVSDFYGGFPAERAMLAIVPVAGRAAVLHGKVLPESRPGVALLLGSSAGPEDLYADWILTHELFHLGFPSFAREGKWLDEGLATYFEPLIRARKHWLKAEDVWAEFARYMPEGVRVIERDGLENPRSFRGLYWAGALVSLMADVEARKRGQSAAGLQRALRELLRAGGEASRVWRLEDAIGHIDGTLGEPIVARLARRYRAPGSRVQLSKLFRELGVKRVGQSVILDDDAPLARVRQAIIRGED